MGDPEKVRTLPWQTLWYVHDLRQLQGLAKYLKARDCLNEMSETRKEFITHLVACVGLLVSELRSTTERALVTNEEEKTKIPLNFERSSNFVIQWFQAVFLSSLFFPR